MSKLRCASCGQTAELMLPHPASIGSGWKTEVICRACYKTLQLAEGGVWLNEVAKTVLSERNGAPEERNDNV